MFAAAKEFASFAREIFAMQPTRPNEDFSLLLRRASVRIRLLRRVRPARRPVSDGRFEIGFGTGNCRPDFDRRHL